MEKAIELTKTIVPRGMDWVYVIHWKDENGQSHTEYPETRKEWDARAAALKNTGG